MGSYLGARSAIEALSHTFHNQMDGKTQVYFAGQQLSSTYLTHLLELLDGKDISVNVISKSGTTTEPAVEKEGILPVVRRNESRMRVYDKADIEWLKFACCLRETGMTIVEMKEFARLTLQGDETIDERMNRLHKQKERVKSQVDQLVSYLSMIEHKLEFYSKLSDEANVNL